MTTRSSNTRYRLLIPRTNADVEATVVNREYKYKKDAEAAAEVVRALGGGAYVHDTRRGFDES